jgi:hypothetical protein
MDAILYQIFILGVLNPKTIQHIDMLIIKMEKCIFITLFKSLPKKIVLIEFIPHKGFFSKVRLEKSLDSKL